MYFILNSLYKEGRVKEVLSFTTKRAGLVLLMGLTLGLRNKPNSLHRLLFNPTRIRPRWNCVDSKICQISAHRIQMTFSWTQLCFNLSMRMPLNHLNGV